jgi:hypothetical protein
LHKFVGSQSVYDWQSVAKVVDIKRGEQDSGRAVVGLRRE